MKTARAFRNRPYLLTEPVQFKIIVGKSELQATLTAAKFVNDFASLLTIKFDDGHEDKYDLSSGHVYTASGERDKYCLALEREAYRPFYAWVPYRKIIILRFLIEDTDANVWIIRDEFSGVKSSGEPFGIYYGGEFRFQLESTNGQWIASDGMGKTISVETQLFTTVADTVNNYLNS